MDLAVLLSAGPPAAAVTTAWQLARAAVARGYAAGIFMMDDGVYAAPVLAAQAAAAGLGGRLPLVRCAENARRRGLAPVDGVTEGSQADWALWVANARRAISLGAG